MAETVYNLTIPSTSATISYSPYVIDNANSGGWQNSTHTTSSFKASFQFSFDGVGIYLVGNTTHNLGYDISLDGAHFPGNFRSNIQSLFSSVDLEPGLHTISLTVRQPVSLDSPGSITLKEVVVNAGTGRSGATVSKKVLDDNDQSIAYYAPPGGNWTIANAYPRAVEPEGLATFVFHDSYWTNATATIGFKGAGISVYGACYSHSRYAAYSASIDGSDEIQYDGTINLYSIGGDIKQRAGNCLRYFKAGLDAEKDHQLVLKVKDMGRLAVDWVEIYTVEGGQAIDNGQGGGSSGINNNTRVAIIAGAISGGVVLMLALLTILPTHPSKPWRSLLRQHPIYAQSISWANRFAWCFGYATIAAATDSCAEYLEAVPERRTTSLVLYREYRLWVWMARFGWLSDDLIQLHCPTWPIYFETISAHRSDGQLES
ncbi:hypothetical protein RSAG8_05449, partial [Rhizoctonia solani AG-8 WAC10335]